MDTLSTFKPFMAIALSISCANLIFITSAQAASFTESEKGEAGAFLSNAIIIDTKPRETPLDRIIGTLGGRADLYQIYLSGEAFMATTQAGTDAFANTQLFLFDQNGIGLYANDDTPQTDSRFEPDSTRSTIRLDANVLTPGLYYLGVSSYGFDPLGADGNPIFPMTAHRALYGPGNSTDSPLTNWVSRANRTTAYFSYTVSLSGTRYVPIPTPIPPPPPDSTSTVNDPPPVAIEPTPVPPVAIEPTPVPPVAIEPTPVPPVVIDPTPVPPVAIEPTPVPPVVTEPTPVPPVVTEPTPVVTNPPPVSVPEPSSLFGLVALGAFGGSLRLRRKRH